MKKYRTLRDILIPAGTEVTAEMPHKTQHYTESAVVTIEVTRDIAAEWRMDLEEAIEAELIEEAK